MINLIDCAEIFVKEQLSSKISDGHDFDHTMRVVNHALKLCRDMPQADVEIVHLAAILHDVGRPLEASSQGAVDHAGKGAQIARDFLLQTGMPAERAERVARCISEHRFRNNRKPSSIEAEILFDADKLDSLGAVGIARAFFFAGKVGAGIHNSASQALAGAAYSRDDTAYREYLVKLSKLPERMLTPQGRIQAEELKGFMDEFFSQLNKEFFQ